MRLRSLALSGPTASQKTPGPIAWLAIAPRLLWVAAFVVAPTVIMLIYSVGRRGTLGGVVYGFTLEHYATLFDRTYLRIILRSLYLAGLTTVICAVVGYPIAYTIGRAEARWRNPLLLLL